MIFVAMTSVCNLLITAVHTEREREIHTHTGVLTAVSRDRNEKSKIEQQSFQQGLEGEVGLTVREAQHLRKAFEFQAEQQQGRNRVKRQTK